MNTNNPRATHSSTLSRVVYCVLVTALTLVGLVFLNIFIQARCFYSQHVLLGLLTTSFPFAVLSVAARHFAKSERMLTGSLMFFFIVMGLQVLLAIVGAGFIVSLIQP